MSFHHLLYLHLHPLGTLSWHWSQRYRPQKYIVSIRHTCTLRNWLHEQVDAGTSLYEHTPKLWVFCTLWYGLIYYFCKPQKSQAQKDIGQKLNTCSVLSTFGRQASVKSSKRFCSKRFNAPEKFTKSQPVAATFALISLLPMRESPTVPHITDSQADSCKCNSSLSSYI